MVLTGLESLKRELPQALKGKRVGVVCHAASVDNNYTHIIDVFDKLDLTVGAIFGPQHGLFGQTQDNMIEWDGDEKAKSESSIPVYSLYGETRKPSQEMLTGLDALVIDLQDVGARPYTYIWTVKHAMDATLEAGISLWVLDRPNPVGAVKRDGAVLAPDHFTFVGGAEIPLCHGMTMGEMALWVQKEYLPTADLNVVKMEGWVRNSLFRDTGLPWVIPSPNMPTLETAIVYPGQVILETVNISEGRGTTTPFEMFGAPWINRSAFRKAFDRQDIKGVLLRDHDFLPTFNKYHNELCGGFQMHVTDLSQFETVITTAAILKAAYEIAPNDFSFTKPPYEYEYDKPPVDIVSGDPTLRNWVLDGDHVNELRELWAKPLDTFNQKFESIKLYEESL